MSTRYFLRTLTAVLTKSVLAYSIRRLRASDWRGLPGTVRLEVFAAQEALPAQLGIRCAGRDRNRPRDHR